MKLLKFFRHGHARTAGTLYQSLWVDIVGRPMHPEKMDKNGPLDDTMSWLGVHHFLIRSQVRKDANICFCSVAPQLEEVTSLYPTPRFPYKDRVFLSRFHRN